MASPFTLERSSEGWPGIKKNSRPQSEDGASAERSPELVGHYEQLRKHALSLHFERTYTAGSALFIRGGMIAWMRAWPSCVQISHKEPAPDPNAPTNILDCSIQIRSQVAIILAGMILSQPWEASK